MKVKISRIIIIDIIIAAVFAAAIGFLGVTHQKWHIVSEMESFTERTLGLEGILTNYLMGEQKICNNWARYVNKEGMTIEEAVEFVRKSEREGVMAHIVYTDDGNYNGLSTDASAAAPDNYSVSYAHLDYLQEVREEDFSENRINALKVFSNPVNGVMSFGFYHPVILKDGKKTRDALLIRVVSVSEIEDRFEYMSKEYGYVEIAIVDMDGNYILKGPGFKHQNFFEECSDYNSEYTYEDIKEMMTGRQGSTLLVNDENEECLVAHIPLEYRTDRILVDFMKSSELPASYFVQILIALTILGLGILLVFNVRMLRRCETNLTEASGTADASVQEKKEFLSTMSHNIRNPLNEIIGLSSIARSKSEDTELVQEYLREINLTGDNLVTMINDIQDTYDMEAGRLTLDPVNFSIARCAERLSHIAGYYSRRKNLDFNFYIDRIEHEDLVGDRLRIDQIFFNILLNALQYTEENGRVDIELGEDVGRTPETVQIIYRVSDTGIGMDADVLANAYEPFFRGEDALSYNPDGRGMGLAVTKQIVDLMGGTIECRSRKGSGTTVTVVLELPVAEQNVESMVLPAKHVLVLDDDEKLRLTAQETLYSLGIVAEIASTGEEAIHMIEEEHEDGEDYDLAIIDWRMAEMDGLTAAKLIKEKMGDASPRLLISAYEWSDFQEDAEKIGIDGFISKPLFRVTMYWKIAEMLGIGMEAIKEDDFIRGMNVLVVEDNNVNWGIVAYILENYGITCEHASNGRKAVERMIEAKPMEFSAILMDVRMPEMNGIEATKAIRNLQNVNADIPIIAMTAMTFADDVDACMDAGMDGFLEKPVEAQRLIKELRRIRKQRMGSRINLGRNHVQFDDDSGDPIL